MLTRVKISERLLQKISSIQPIIGRKLAFSIGDVFDRGLNEVGKIAGHHDELVKGKRIG